MATRILRNPEEAEAPPSPSPPHAPRPGAGLVALVTAAVALLAVLLTARGEAPRWRVVAVEGKPSGHLLVDGARVDWGASFAHPLSGGQRLDVPPRAHVTLVCEDRVAVALHPGTSFVLPTLPHVWFDRDATAELTAGVALLATGPGFAGSRLDIATPEGAVRATGTTLAMFRDDLGTCAGTHEGRVEVVPHEGEAAPVTPGLRRYAYRGGGLGELQPQNADEEDLLRRFDAEAQALLAP